MVRCGIFCLMHHSLELIVLTIFVLFEIFEISKKMFYNGGYLLPISRLLSGALKIWSETELLMADNSISVARLSWYH